MYRLAAAETKKHALMPHPSHPTHQVEQGVMSRRCWVLSQCADVGAAQGVARGPWFGRPVCVSLLVKCQQALRVARTGQTVMVAMLCLSSCARRQPPERGSVRVVSAPAHTIAPHPGSWTLFLRRCPRPLARTPQQASRAGRWGCGDALTWERGGVGARGCGSSCGIHRATLRVRAWL